MEASYETLMRQAADTADCYLGRAVADIDERFGTGTAAKSPELVAAYMRAASSDFSTMVLANKLEDALDRIIDALERD